MKLNSRGLIVVTAAVTTLVIAVLIGGFFVATHLWTTPTGYCWGTPQKCGAL